MGRRGKRGKRGGAWIGVAVFAAVFVAAGLLLQRPAGDGQDQASQVSAPTQAEAVSPPPDVVEGDVGEPPQAAGADTQPLRTAPVVEIRSLVDAVADIPHRITGSEQNARAALLVEGLFAEIGLSPLDRPDHRWPYTQEMDGGQIAVYNLVGVVPGRVRRDAVVLSAHFDSVDTPGAIDNGSGLAALLYLADRLCLRGEALPFDVVVCAFNGEEQFFLGSMPFVEQIGGRYERLCNVNIDSVGMVDGGLYALGCGEGEVGYGLNRALREVLDRHPGVAYNDRPVTGVNSDHLSFERAGYPNVNFTQESTYRYIHTQDDTPDRVDEREVEALCRAILDFLESLEAVDF